MKQAWLCHCYQPFSHVLSRIQLYYDDTFIIIVFFVLMLASSVTNAVTILSAPNATNEVHSFTVICTIHPDSTADQCVVMAMADDGRSTAGNYVCNSHCNYCTSVRS